MPVAPRPKKKFRTLFRQIQDHVQEYGDDAELFEVEEIKEEEPNGEEVEFYQRQQALEQ